MLYTESDDVLDGELTVYTQSLLGHSAKVVQFVPATPACDPT